MVSRVHARADSPGRLSNALGYDIDLANLPSPHPRPMAMPDTGDTAAALVVRILLPWDLIEKSRGVYDWTVLDELVVGHAKAGFTVILEPHGNNRLHGDSVGEGAEAWEAFLGALGDRYKDQVSAYLVGRDIRERCDPTYSSTSGRISRVTSFMTSHQIIGFR